eukprot:7578575-Alexandrium_andersonii.AAC.1
MLHCMHRLHLSWASGGQCIETSAGQLEREWVEQGDEALASLVFADSFVLRCVHCVLLEWGGGGRCIEWRE